MKNMKQFVVLGFLVSILFCQAAAAAVRIVGDPTPDYVTIQAAIDNAGPMGHIMVSTGTYAEVLAMVDFYDGLIIEGNFNHDFTEKVVDGETIIGPPAHLPDGRVVTIMNSKDVELIDLIVMYGRAPLSGEWMDGGGIHISESSEVQIERCTVILNRANGFGGGIYVEDSSLRVIDSHIAENRANNATVGAFQPAGRGGGIAVQNGTLEIDVESTTRIIDNNADYAGGGIFLHSSSDALLMGFVDVLNNTAQFGGGVAVTGGSTVEIRQGPFVCGNTANVDGGGIWLDASSTGRVSGIFTRIGLNHPAYGANRALAGNGGGLFVRESSLVVSDQATIAHNVASELGGGIFMTNSTGVIDGAYVGWPYDFHHTNTAQFGGGIFAQASHLTLTNAAVIHGNRGIGAGGGMYALYVTTIVHQAHIQHNRSMTGVAGGFYAAGGRFEATDLLVLSNTTAVTGGGGYLASNHAFFDGGEFRHNTANLDAGGLYALHRAVIMTNTLFSRNHAGRDGGALFMSSAGHPALPTRLSRIQIEHNTADGDGGGLWITNSTVFVDGLDAYMNRADADENGNGNGGAIWHAGNQVLNLTSESGVLWVDQNQARHGGGIFASGGTTVRIYREDTDPVIGFENNSTTGDGGAICMVESTLHVSNTLVFASNSARDGGGLFILECSAHLEGGVQIGHASWGGNTASRFGGGMATFISTTTLHSVEFHANESFSYGGGIDHYYGHFAGTNILFSANRSTSSHGGGFSGYGTTGHLVFLEARDNEASLSGGGGTWDSGFLHLQFSSLLFNQADSGGGCSLRSGNHAVWGEVTVSGNHADTMGGGLFLDGASRLTATNLNLIANLTAVVDASNRGGGMSLVQLSRASLHATESGSSMITGNASWFGGGIHAHESWVGLSGNIRIEDNIAGHSGGALALQSATGIVNRVYIQGNEATWTGAGVSVADKSFLSLENTLVAEGHLTESLGGGGLDITDSMAFIELCSIVNNSDWGIYQGDADVWVSDSLIYGNLGPSVSSGVAVQYSNIEGGHAGTGNFDAPPLLYEGNYHLTAWSPCRGAGQLAGPGHFDVDGEVRPDGVRFDVGFDHFQDSDGDGLPDIVETGTGIMLSDLDMGTNPHNPDSSGNGQSDGDAWLAGLDPNDPDSRLEMLGAEKVATGMRIHWRGGTAAYQMFEYRTNLVTGVWQQHFMAIPPTPAINHLVYDGPEDAVNFRIRASRFGF